MGNGAESNNRILRGVCSRVWFKSFVGFAEMSAGRNRVLGPAPDLGNGAQYGDNWYCNTTGAYLECGCNSLDKGLNNIGDKICDGN